MFFLETEDVHIIIYICNTHEYMYHYCIFTCISQDQISVNTSLPSVWRWGPTNRIRFREETGAMSRFFRMGVVVFVDFFFPFFFFYLLNLFENLFSDLTSF